MEQKNSLDNAILHAQDLTKSFADQYVVNHVSFNVYPGECLGLLGPNGAGKTTTLKMILGQTLADEGSLNVLGFHLPDEASQLRKHIGVVPQHDNLDPDFSVYENLLTYSSYFNLDQQQFTKRIDQLLKFAALENKSTTKVTTLSGGMKRRLILARALLNDPQLLILDEPTTGLDPQARHIIWQSLRTLKQRGVTQILTTHYMEEAERLCDRVIIIDKGSILDEGKPRNLIKRHIEDQVIEIQSDHIRDWYNQHRNIPGQRMELIGDTLFCYCHDEQPILKILKSYAELQYLRRNANLEDVFLKLTGRELREEI